MMAVTIIQQGFKENINRQHMHAINHVPSHKYSLKVTWNFRYVFLIHISKGL